MASEPNYQRDYWQQLCSFSTKQETDSACFHLSGYSAPLLPIITLPAERNVQHLSAQYLDLSALGTN